MSQLALILFGAFFTAGAAWGLGRVCCRRVSAPPTIALACGAPLLSLSVFLLLLAGAASRTAFLITGVISIAAALIASRGRSSLRSGSSSLPSRTTKWLLTLVLAPYAVLYVAHSMAPEIQPDGITYHLGLVADYLRRGAFSGRIAFYEMLPHGMELLFAFSFAFGGASAAKLLHFIFLASTFPLMLAIGRQLGLSAATSAIAASFYLLAPVVGVSGTSTYTDAALVFFTLAAFYLLWSWKEHENDWYLLPAGVVAGFCYAVKPTGLLVVALAVLFVAATRPWKAVLAFAGGAALMIAPWVIRSLVMTGNPAAPLLNGLFPNPYFHAQSTASLLDSLRQTHQVSLATAPLELTVRGRLLHGLLGPVFLLSPIGLLALRQRSGRLVAGIAVLMALPWFLNPGARFLMPGLPWLSLLLAMALPKPAAWACVFFHAATCWPQAVDLYAAKGAWRLQGFPWQAALRLQPEREYLRKNLRAYRLAEMVEQETQPGARILDLIDAPKAFISRELVGSWQSAEGERLAEALATAAAPEQRRLHMLEAGWTGNSLEALRVVWASGPEALWSIHEVMLYRGQQRIGNSRHWRVGASANVWETPLAFDGSLVSGWNTWRPARPGDYLEIEFGRPTALTSATLVAAAPADMASLEFHGFWDGRWRRLAGRPVATPYHSPSLRPAAIRFLRRHGIRYILARVGHEGYGLVGTDLAAQTSAWGIVLQSNLDGAHLYRIPK